MNEAKATELREAIRKLANQSANLFDGGGTHPNHSHVYQYEADITQAILRASVQDEYAMLCERRRTVKKILKLRD